MQLRVARLCLDCEELFVGNSCPICASGRYAFLSRWLPSDERRKWRGRGPRTADVPHGLFQTAKRAFARWFGDIETTTYAGQLRTRASDVMPRLDFGEPRGLVGDHRRRVRKPLKSD